MTVKSELILSKKHILDLLRYLDEHDNVITSELQFLTQDWKTLTSLLNLLVEKGIITEERNPKKKSIVMYNLTERGRKVCELIGKAEMITKGEMNLEEL